MVLAGGRLLRLAHLRELNRHRLQTLLLGLGICLGVAVVVGVDLANASARAGFDAGWRSLYGASSHSISSSSGAAIRDQDYLALRARWRAGDPDLAAIAAMVPVLAATVRVTGAAGERAPVRLLGLDLLAAGAMGELAQAPGQGFAATVFSQPGAVLAGAALAERLGLVVGDQVSLAVGRNLEVPVTLVGLVGRAEDPASDGVLLADLATAQEVLGQLGQLSRIDLRLHPVAGQAVAGQTPMPAANAGSAWQLLDRLFPGLGAVTRASGNSYQADQAAVVPARALAAGWQLVAVAALADATRDLGGAFHFNLGALSLLALAVAAFLVHQSVQFSVARRQLQWQRQLAMGVLVQELRLLVTMEVVLVALVATALGLLLGGWLAGALLGLVTTTVSDLYFVLTVRQLQWDLLLLAKAALLGLGLATLVAWRAAGRTSSGDSAEDAGVVAGPRLARAGLALALALVLLVLPGVVPALLAVAALLLGSAWLLAPLLAALAGLVGRWLPAQALTARMALRRSARNADQAGVAVAALMVAAAAGLGMALMIASFRVSVEGWLEQRLSADFYLRLDQAAEVDPEALQAFAKTRPGVADLVLYAGTSTVLAGQLVTLEVAGPAAPGWARFPLLAGSLPGPDEALASESLARRLGCMDAPCGVALDTPLGRQQLRLSGVFVDYGGRQRLAMAGPLFQRWFGPPQWQGVALWLQPDATATARAEVRSWLQGMGGEVRDQRSLLAISLQVFDRTFAVTLVLRWLAVLVAVAGLAAALLALQLDRHREFRVLAALGLRRRDLQQLVLVEASLLGLAAGLMAVPVGLMVAWLIVADLNVAAFGWRFPLALHWPALLQTPVLALLAGALAGVLAAWRLPDNQVLLQPGGQR